MVGVDVAVCFEVASDVASDVDLCVAVVFVCEVVFDLIPLGTPQFVRHRKWIRKLRV
ncbi:hypothetical protein [Undibacterium sp. Ji49W]|uniref:hypothetical protein n=1 Tax=Undibacterium sp. Ji49W TaxID=3413040 RepID=UPI003BF0F21C